MFEHLQIYDRRERCMVGLADAGLAVLAGALRPFRRRRPAARPPQRILLLRLERIGDLLMSWPAIAAVRQMAPDARIDLVVGSWNAAIAGLFEDVSRVRTLDARWLSRPSTRATEPGGRSRQAAPGQGILRLLREARAWRREQYDWAINFEGDIRSHLLMALSGAPRRIGFDMAGGGPLLTDRIPYDPSSHVADNLLRLVDHAFAGRARRVAPRDPQPLPVPTAARTQADTLLAEAFERSGPAIGGLSDSRTSGLSDGPLIGIHVSGGRPVKQWDPIRFGDVGARLVADHGARLVFTGSHDDRPLVDVALARLPRRAVVADLCGRADLLTLAAVFERLSVLITGDTGPMHLAAAVGTPLVAMFGPSDPRRWGPLSAGARIVLGAVECRPCNRIRRPPARCGGAMPECLAAITVDQVVEAAGQVLATQRPEHGTRPGGVAAEVSDAGR